MPHVSAPLPIGGHVVADPVGLAPMSGITDRPFRLAVAAFGAGYVVSEMISGDRLSRGDFEARLKLEGAGVPLNIVQIAGCSPEALASGAKIACDHGAQVIDINMGCPAKRVTGGYAGSALMRDLDHAQRLIAATVAAVAVPVTLKMRLGWDDASLNAAELARRAEAEGVRLVTVHARTRQQFYNGKADWTKVRAVREAISLPLVVNGDIIDGPSAVRALHESGADAVMVGRASVGQPWLLAEIAAFLRGDAGYVAPTFEEQCAALTRLYWATLDHYGERIGLRHIRKHLAAALDRLPAPLESDPAFSALKTRILTGTNPSEVVSGLENAFLQCVWSKAA